MKYRDRAKERRDKYGSPAIVPGWKKRLEREMASADSEPPIPLVVIVQVLHIYYAKFFFTDMNSQQWKVCRRTILGVKCFRYDKVCE